MHDTRVKVQEPAFELSGWFSVNFWSRERTFSSVELGGIRVIRVRVKYNRVKMTEKWGVIQGKLDLLQVSEELELSE